MNSRQTNLTSPQDTEFFGDDIEISEDQAEGNFLSSADEKEEELFEDVEEGLVLAVDVGDEVLGALGQVQDGLQIDDLTAGRLDGGVLAGEHL